MREFEAKIHGPVGNGKTVVLASLYHYLNDTNSKVDAIPDYFSDAIKAQWERLQKGKFPNPTMLADQEVARLTLIRPSVGGGVAFNDKLKIVSFSGETWKHELSKAIETGDVSGLSGLAKEFAVGRPNVLIITLNPFVWSRELARLAYKGLIVRLCEEYMAAETAGSDPDPEAGPPCSPLEKACEMAYLALFGRRPKELHSCSPEVDGKLKNLPASARLLFEIDEPDKAQRFHVPSDQANQPWAGGFLVAVNKAAECAADDFKEQLRRTQLMASHSDQVMIVLSHIDLLHLIYGLRKEEDLRPIFSKVLGNKVPRPSQCVWGENLKVKFDEVFQCADRQCQKARPAVASEPDPLKPGVGTGPGPLEKAFYVLDILEDSSRDLMEKLRQELDAIPPPPPPPPPPETITREADGRTVGDLIREAFHRGLQASPAIFGVAILGGLVASGSAGEAWQSLWKWIAAAGLCLASGAAGFSILRARLSHSAWMVRRIGGIPVRVELSPLAGKAVEGPPESLRIGTGILGRLFNFGGGRFTTGGPRSPIPRLRALRAIVPNLEPKRSMDTFGDLFVLLILLLVLGLVVGSLIF